MHLKVRKMYIFFHEQISQRNLTQKVTLVKKYIDLNIKFREEPKLA